MQLTGARASDGHYVLLFEGGHEDCKHTKHIARVNDYQFVFCKETQEPLAIYCGDEIVSEEDVLVLIGELGERFGLMGDIVMSPYFKKFATAVLDVSYLQLLQ